VLPRKLFSVPITISAIARGLFPIRLTDALNMAIMRLAIGSLERYGLERSAKRPREVIINEGRAPVIDV
jgi:hypothetical protein